MQKNQSGFMSMAIGLTLILVGVSLWEYKDFNLPYMQTTSQSQTAGAINQGGQNNQAQTTGTQYYQDNRYGFSIQYPNDFVLEQSPYRNVSFNVPEKEYFRTVLVKDGDINLAVEPPSTICSTNDIVNTNMASTSIVGSPAGNFEKKFGSDAGAGQLYDEVTYTLKTNTLCYVVYLEIHSTNGAGFYYNDPQQIADTDAQQAKDKTAFLKLIDQMVSTFTLTK